MPFITREDGERFIIPSYRDTLSAKKTGLLKREVLLLSSQYGEYITLQKKAANQYEVAFSPDPGYLLGECVWQHFKRPFDMVYCESIPNTSEAILVIVKEGSVYLDGTFPIDSIPEELVIFKTQKNNFSIYVDANVPISETSEEGKFSFDASSVKSFTVLQQPVFPILTGVKAFQLQQVEFVLRQHGIGVFPVGKVILALFLLILGWYLWSYISSPVVIERLPTQLIVPVREQSNMQAYIEALRTPDPVQEMQALQQMVLMLYSIPGWTPQSIEYTSGVPVTLTAIVRSSGAKVQLLLDWATTRNVKVDILPDGIHLTMTSLVAKREIPTTISAIENVLGSLVDRFSYVVPGNSIQFGPSKDNRLFQEKTLTVNFSNISPTMLTFLGSQFNDLPVAINGANLTISNGYVSGSITFKAFGN